MDGIKKLRNIIVLLVVLFVLGLVLLTIMIPMKSFVAWVIIGTQVVVILYFVALSLGLIKEVEQYGKNNPKQ